MVVAALCVGLSIGVKLTGLPFLAYFVLVLILIDRLGVKDLIIFAAIVLIGFILANPFNLDLYLTNIILDTKLHSNNLTDLTSIKKIFFQENWSWDNILANSFSNFIFHPLLLAIFNIAVMIKNWRMALILSIFCMLSFFMVMKSDGYVWYFLPFIPAIIFSLSALEGGQEKQGNQKTKNSFKISVLAIAITVVVILANFHLNIRTSVRQSYEKWMQIQALEQFPAECIAEQIRKYQPEFVVVMPEFGAATDIAQLHSIPIGVGYGAKFDINKRSMWIIGSRLIANPYHLKTIIPDKVPFQKYAICNNIFVMVNQ